MELIFLMPAVSGGGIEVSIPLIVDTLRLPQDAQVRIVAINSEQRDIYQVSAGSIDVDGLGRRSGDLCSTITSFHLFNELLRNVAGDITLIANGEVAEVFSALTMRKIRRRIVVEHTSQPWKKTRLLGILIRSILKGRKTVWVTVTPQAKKIFPWINRFTFIPNPVRNVPRTAENQRGDLRLVFIGRLIESKNPKIVCNLSRELNIPLSVFGSGDLERHLIDEYASSLVKFYGYVNDVWKSIPVTDLLVVPSLYEGDGRVIAEAISLGQPLILLDTPDHRRFRLPEKNYFKGEDDLIKKLRVALEFGSATFAIPFEQQEHILRERSVGSVSAKWNKLLFDK